MHQQQNAVSGFAWIDGLDLDEYRDDVDIVDTIGRRVKFVWDKKTHD